MTTAKTIQLLRTGHIRIDVEPVWQDETIVLFDFYIEGQWQGSRRLLRYIEEEYGFRRRPDY